MSPKIYPILVLLPLFILTLVSCSDGEDNAAIAIEAYITALSDRDANRISSLSCADWESSALVEIDSLTAVGSNVENLSCQPSRQEGEDLLITCTGILALDYGGEAQQIDLSSRVYIARLEGGEWRMCGYR